MTHFLTRALQHQRGQRQTACPDATGRRQFMLSTAAAAGATLSLTATASATPTTPTFPVGRIRSEFLHYPNPEEHQRQSYRILRNLHDKADVLFWYHFQMFAVIDGRRPEAVVRWEGIEFSHHQKLSRSVYRVAGHNLSFPRDLSSGKWTDKTLNPITGEAIAVPPMALTEDPGYVYTPKGVIPLDNPDAPPRIRHEQFLIEGDLVKIEQVRQPPASWPATFIETSANWSPLSLFEDNTILDLPTGTSGGYIFPWPAWMKMGDQPGHMFATWNGRKLPSVDNLPLEFIQRAQSSHPELLEVDKTAFNEALPESIAMRLKSGEW
ncbi:MAG: hypothetical protein AB8B96_05105 [Lysobacterales bacterium]